MQQSLSYRSMRYIFLLAVVISAVVVVWIPEKLSYLTVIVAFLSLWRSIIADEMAILAKQDAQQTSQLIGLNTNLQIVTTLKSMLEPHYGSQKFIDEAKKLMDSGYEKRSVIQAMELALASADKRSPDAKYKRLIDYRAELLDYEPKKTSQ